MEKQPTNFIPYIHVCLFSILIIVIAKMYSIDLTSIVLKLIDWITILISLITLITFIWKLILFSLLPPKERDFYEMFINSFYLGFMIIALRFMSFIVGSSH